MQMDLKIVIVISQPENALANIVLLEINALNVLKIILGSQIAKVILFFVYILILFVCLSTFQLFVYNFRQLQMQC